MHIILIVLKHLVYKFIGVEYNIPKNYNWKNKKILRKYSEIWLFTKNFLVDNLKKYYVRIAWKNHLYESAGCLNDFM